VCGVHGGDGRARTGEKTGVAGLSCLWVLSLTRAIFCATDMKVYIGHFSYHFKAKKRLLDRDLCVCWWDVATIAVSDGIVG